MSAVTRATDLSSGRCPPCEVNPTPTRGRVGGTDTFAVDLLESLVRIPSLSGSEHAASAYLVGQMQTLGYGAHVDEAGSAVGMLGDPSPGAKEIVLLGHIDTVPGDVPVRREGDVLWGRGSVDAKGPLCAFVVGAARAHLPPGVRVWVVGATEEEAVSSKGARHFAVGRRPDACIIGEPSAWDGVTLGYKGRMLCHASVTRDTAHTARPVPGAAEVAADYWHKVREMCAERNEGSKGAFDTLQPSLQYFNTVTNGLHETATLTIGFRLPPGTTPGDVEHACRALAPEGAALEFVGKEVAHQSDRSGLVARALTTSIRAAGGRPIPKLKTGTCDMNILAPIWNCPIAAYGPGDSTLDHTPEERVSISEYLRAIDVVRRAVESIAHELTSR